MDATRARRQRGAARRTWYARFRQWRLARHMGFLCSQVGLLDRPATSRPADDAELLPFDRTPPPAATLLLPAALPCAAWS